MSKLYFTILLLSLILLSISFTDSKVGAEEEHIVVEQVEELNLTPVEYATIYANHYGIDEGVFKKVMWCESRNNPDAVGDNGKAKNVMQFHKPTFDSYAKKLGEDLDYNSYHDQIKVAAYMFSIGEAKQWTAYRAIINGGTYSFYSSSLGKHYTATCK
jgi:hypothetical protein